MSVSELGWCGGQVADAPYKPKASLAEDFEFSTCRAKVFSFHFADRCAAGTALHFGFFSFSPVTSPTWRAYMALLNGPRKTPTSLCSLGGLVSGEGSEGSLELGLGLAGGEVGHVVVMRGDLDEPVGAHGAHRPNVVLRGEHELLEDDPLRLLVQHRRRVDLHHLGKRNKKNKKRKKKKQIVRPIKKTYKHIFPLPVRAWLLFF